MVASRTTYPAISVREPWASLFFINVPGRKDVENRTFQLRHRGRLYIHVSRTVVMGEYAATMSHLWSAVAEDRFPGLTHDHLRQLDEPKRLAHLGHFIGVVNLVDITLESDSPWAVDDEQWKWRVEDPYLIDRPVPYKGHQGAFWVPADTFRGRTFSPLAAQPHGWMRPAGRAY